MRSAGCDPDAGPQRSGMRSTHNMSFSFSPTDGQTAVIAVGLARSTGYIIISSFAERNRPAPDDD